MTILVLSFERSFFVLYIFKQLWIWLYLEMLVDDVGIEKVVC